MVPFMSCQAVLGDTLFARVAPRQASSPVHPVLGVLVIGVLCNVSCWELLTPPTSRG